MVRLFVGGAVTLTLLAVFIVTVQRIGSESPQGQEISAVQAIQVYAEGCFYAITAIGIAICAYIATRIQPEN